MAQDMLVEQRTSPEPVKPSVLSKGIIEELVRTDWLTQKNDYYRRESVGRYETFGQFVESGADLDIFLQENSLHYLSQRWANFSSNPQVREAFGEKLDKAEEVLGRAVFEQSCSESTEDQNYAYTDMFEFKNPAIASFYILESIRKAGESKHYLENLRDYLFGFPPDRLKKLKESDIPGIKEITEAVTSIDKESLAKPEVLDFLKKQAAQLSFHYLMNGDPDQKVYVVERFSSLLIANIARDDIMIFLNSPATSQDLVKEFFTNSYNPYVEDSSFPSELFMDYAKQQDTETVRAIFKKYEISLADFAIGRGLREEDLDLFSKVHELSIEDVKHGLELAVKEKEITGTNVLQVFSLSELAELSRSDMSSLLADLHALGYEYNDFQNDPMPLGRERVQENILMDKNVLDRLMENKDTHIPFLEQLHSYGYKLRASDLDNFEEALRNKERTLISLAEARKYKQDFSYYSVENPYKGLARGITGYDSSYGAYVAVKSEMGDIPRRFSDPVFEQFSEKDAELTEERNALFNKHFNSSVNEALKDPRLTWFYSSRFFLNRIANNPDTADYVINFPHKFSRLFNLLSDGGPLDTNRDETIDSIFSDEEFSEKNTEEKAQKILGVFKKKNPYWKQRYWFTEKRLVQELLNASSEYPIRNIAGIPVANLIRGNRERIKTIVKDEAVLKDLLEGKIDYIPFASLSGVYKKIVFRSYIRRAVTESRDENKKREADIRNREILQQDLGLQEGDYFHGTRLNMLSGILLNGNLTEETLRGTTKTYSNPFHVDFSRVTKQDIESKFSVDVILKHSMAAIYAEERHHGEDINMQFGIFLVMKRENSDFEAGVDYTEADSYGLILGAVPSTAIDAIVLRDAKALAIAAKEIAENGFYIPVYDINGKILLTPEDYDVMKADRNIGNVPVEVWDNSLKTGEQKGSNPAAEFTVPGKDGPERFYVKFQTEANEDQIWNERLADSIYDALGVAVPKTKVVKVDKGYGHASRIIEGVADGTGGSDNWKKGYLADCLLANWDILSTLEQNTMNNPNNGQVFRIDNGGALLYRAQGLRKGHERFNETVGEIEKSSSVSPERMEISEEELKVQARQIKERLTDEAIDSLVDKVRLRNQDRDYLQNTLRKRRDYILAKFLL